MIRSGGRSATVFSAASPLRTMSASALAAALERVLDQPGDILLVFDNEHAVLGHALPATVPAGGFAVVSKLLNVS